MAKKQYNLFYNPLLPFPIEQATPSLFPVFFDKDTAPVPGLFAENTSTPQYLDLVSTTGELVEETGTITFMGVTYEFNLFRHVTA